MQIPILYLAFELCPQLTHASCPSKNILPQTHHFETIILNPFHLLFTVYGFKDDIEKFNGLRNLFTPHSDF